MERLTHPEKDQWRALCARPGIERGSLTESVSRTLDEVRTGGDQAVLALTSKFDRVDLNAIRVSALELAAGYEQTAPTLRDAMETAAANINRFHLGQKQESREIETMPGVCCWRKSVPISPVGLYVPGGSAPLFSTLLMLGIPASIAGCRRVVVCSPPQSDGHLNPAILFAAELCGISEIYKVGGAQAIAAMAYGTETMPKVHKIFGPGNQYVTMAKQLVQQDGTGIDMPAGPSEVAVIADENSNPRFVAADLLSQAEHGPDSQVVLLCTAESVLDAIVVEVQRQVAVLPRRDIAVQALAASRAILFRSLVDAIEFSNLYAPEHLILATSNARADAEKIENAGSVFIGAYAPESVGDYASGTNHVLPTGGYAAVSAGVSLDSFVKKITFQSLTPDGLRALAPAVCEMASAEGLEGHRRAVEIRIEDS
jgi:histidinol dehydrogenase